MGKGGERGLTLKEIALGTSPSPHSEMGVLGTYSLMVSCFFLFFSLSLMIQSLYFCLLVTPTHLRFSVLAFATVVLFFVIFPLLLCLKFLLPSRKPG